MRNFHPYRFTRTLSVLAITTLLTTSAAAQDRTPAASVGPVTAPGQAATLLPDGRWLLSGGQGWEAALAVWDATTGILLPMNARLQAPRAGHTATLLSDGRILVIGGWGLDGRMVHIAEILDSNADFVATDSVPIVSTRAGHTATLLPDGRVLLAGGISGSGEPLGSIEVWDPETQSTQPLVGPLRSARAGHVATLLPDGRVLISGGRPDRNGPGSPAEIYDPIVEVSSEFTALPSSHRNPAFLTGSDPADGATDVPVEARPIVLRYSAALAVATLTRDTVRLLSSDGAVPLNIVPAEHGRLVFLRPEAPLKPGARYELTVSRVMDAWGRPVRIATLRFTTAHDVSSMPTVPPPDAEVWIPDSADMANGWRTGRPPSPWQRMKPLEAAPGVTALAGQVLRLNGRPLANVRLEMEGRTARTDHTGRFLLRLDDLASGWCELWIDGRPANRPDATYGTFEVGVTIGAGRTNVLPYAIWMPALDLAHAVTIPSPTTSEMVITTPLVPGLELRLPPGTVIRDHDRQVVRQISITPVPLDRPPFPVPPGLEVPAYFTVQPGGAYVYARSAAGTGLGARLIYPNGRGVPANARMEFWHYEPEGPGWYVYGEGSVTPDGRFIVPDLGVGVYEFTGAMVASPNLAPPTGPSVDRDGRDGDPVDLWSGLFVLEKTDIVLPDVIPIVLTRTYRPGDIRSRAFGIGATHPYDMFLVGNVNPYTFIDLVLADGARIHYDRITPGTGFSDAVYEHVSTPTSFYKSTIRYVTDHWEMTLKDGTILDFGDGLFATLPTKGALRRIRDRFGNDLRLTRDASWNLTRIASTHGRTLEFTYDASRRITGIRDNVNRTVGYQYDAGGRLWRVTDPAGGVTEYGYDVAHRITTIRDARNIVFLTNEYDTSDRVFRQTQADSTTYQFVYTVDGSGVVTQAEVTNPRGYVRRVVFNGAGFITSETGAVGTPRARTTTLTRQPGTNFLTTILDPLLRQTDLGYDPLGNLTSITALEGTADEVTTTLTYEPQFSQLASVTDPLLHTWAVSYVGARPTMLVDPLGQVTNITVTPAGQLASVTDMLGQTVQIGYEFSDAVSVTNALGQVSTRFFDGAGRLLRATSPLGRTTLYEVNPLNLVYKLTDPLSGETSFTYDANGNLTSDGAQSYTWNARNQLASLSGSVSASFSYDAFGRRRAKTLGSTTTGFLYDGLNPVQELSGGSPTANLLTGFEIDEYFTRADANGTSNYLTDALGSSVALANSSGAIQTEYTYEPFGSMAATGASSGNTFGFTGREHDETGLHYYRARYYDSRSQRFASEDPIEFASGDVNLFAYVSGQPTGYTDPLGLGRLGATIRIVRRMGHWIREGRSASFREAQNARRRGADVLAPDRRTARQIEESAFRNDPTTGRMMHHDPHRPGYRPHYQTRGRDGHTFYNVIPGAGLGDMVGRKTGIPLLGDFVDFLGLQQNLWVASGSGSCPNV